MKTHTQTYKDNLVKLGKEIDAKVTYTINGVTTELGADELSSVNPHYDGAILKSVMKQVDIESDTDIPINTEINVQFGMKYEDEPYEYIDFGNYIVYSSEKQEDTKNFRIVAYDKMLYSMKEYEDLGITYPITIRDYLNAICTKIGVNFANASDSFTNYNQTIPTELYDNAYTYRDVLDELAQVTASTICINEDDELEVRYINDTQGKNLANINNIVIGKSWCNSNNTNRATIIWIPLETNTNYSLVSSYTNTHITNIRFVFNYGPSDIVSNSVRTSFPTNSGNYTYASIEVLADTTFTKDMLEGVKIMLCEGSATLDDYEPYGDTINEDYIKNTRADFGEKYGPINSIVLSRSAESDNVYLRDEDSVAQNGLCEIKIKDNQIMNDNTRDRFLQGILDALDGLEYYTNNFESIGITYLDLCDRYNVKVDDNYYSCIMFNDEIEIKDGLNEIIYTDMPSESVTDYTKADKTDRRLNQTYLIVDKQQGQINTLISKVVDVSKTITGVDSITLENAHEGQLHYLSIKGAISQLFASNSTYPNNSRVPIGPTLVIDSNEYTLDIDKLRYINDDVCDEFVYKDGECYIIRRVDSNNNPLAQEVIEERQDIILNVESNSTIYLKTFNNIVFNCEYLLENVYTDNFATQVEVKTEIIETENSIEQKVSAVADENGNITSGSILLAINNDESQATINADKISLEGKTINMTSDNIKINSTNFNVDEQGNMTCNNASVKGDITSSNGEIGGWTINAEGLTNGAVRVNSDGSSTIYTVADLIIVRGYIMGLEGFELSNSMIEHYDLNGDGRVTSADFVALQNLIGISMSN